MSQKDIFLTEGEGDSYFRRNQAAYTTQEALRRPSREIDLFTRFLKPTSKLLEIGCANGLKAARLAAAAGCHATGVDPSSSAVEDGANRFPQLDLRVGAADSLEFADASFDFVLFGFCLYLVDRPLLSRVVAEADRVLKDGGFLGITDFSPALPTARAYSHRPGVLSYKMDYAKLFLAYPHYSEAERFSWSHAGEDYCAEPDNRLASCVLAKDLRNGYRAG